MMKKTLLFVFVMILVSNVFGQNLIENGDFTLPDDGKDYNSIDSIPGWMTDDVANGKTMRHILDGNGVASLSDAGASMYQVIGTVPEEATTYSVNLDVQRYYTWNTSYEQRIDVVLSAFSGNDTTTRVPVDSLKLFYNTSSKDWVTKTGELVIEAGNEHAGEHLVFEISMYLHSSSYYTFFYFDNVNIKEKEELPTFSGIFENGDFTLPDDGKDYNSIDSIPGWMTDDVANGKTMRHILDGNGVASLSDAGASMYQVIGTVPEEATTYSVNFDVQRYYTWNTSYEQRIDVIFSAFSGSDPKTRVPIDTVQLFYNTSSKEWLTKTGELTIEAGNAHAGEHLVFEISMYLHSPSYYTFFYFDNVNIKEKEELPTFSGIFENGDFTLPDDGKTYNRIDSIPGWLTDDKKEGNTGRKMLDGNGVAFHWDGAGSIYQVIGTVPSSAAKYQVSFDATCYYSYWAGDYITDVYVIFSSFSGDDPRTRVPIDSLTFTVSAIKKDWNVWVTKTGTFELQAGNAHAGEHLVMEIDIFNSRDLGYSESWTYLYYDNVGLTGPTGAVINKIEDQVKVIPYYPGKIKIQAREEIKAVSVYDITGRKISVTQTNSFNPEITIGNLNGTYIVKVDLGNRFVTKKVYLR